MKFFKVINYVLYMMVYLVNLLLEKFVGVKEFVIK